VINVDSHLYPNIFTYCFSLCLPFLWLSSSLISPCNFILYNVRFYFLRFLHHITSITSFFDPLTLPWFFFLLTFSLIYSHYLTLISSHLFPLVLLFWFHLHIFISCVIASACNPLPFFICMLLCFSFLQYLNSDLSLYISVLCNSSLCFPIMVQKPLNFTSFKLFC